MYVIYKTFVQNFKIAYNKINFLTFKFVGGVPRTVKRNVGPTESHKSNARQNTRRDRSQSVGRRN